MKANRFIAIAAACAVAVSGFAITSDVKAAQKPIAIKINGEALNTDAAPYIQNGATFVPFRALFEALGLQVAWDPASKRIVGTGGGANIELQVGSRTAIVNSTAVQLSSPPAIVGGRTFVPLRFVSEAAEATVEWYSAERLVSVVISGGAPIDEVNKEALMAVYNDYIRMGNENNAAGVLRLFHEESPLLPTLQSNLANHYSKRDVQTTVEFITVEGANSRGATLKITEKHMKESGAFYMDNRTELQVTMRVNNEGQWRLFDAKTLAQEWLIPYGWSPVEAVVDHTVLTAAKNTMAAYLEALKKEDVQGAMQWVDVTSPERQATEAALRWMFATYDLTHDMEDIKVLERSGNELFVYTVQTTRKQSGPKFADVRTQTIHTLRQQPDGSWKLYSTTNGPVQTISLPQ